MTAITAAGSSSSAATVAGVGISFDPTATTWTGTCFSLPTNSFGRVRVYADGRLVFTRELVTSGEMMRLPSGFKAQFWQIEVEARVKVYSIQVGTSAKELRGV